MNKAIVLKDKNFKGPMATSLAQTGYDIKTFDDDLMSYDYIIVFYNKLPPRLNTKAVIGWWMNDFRKPDEVSPGNYCYYFDFIFLCTSEVFNDYLFFFKKPVFYMPQCGIDSGFNNSSRNIDWDILFIGGITHPVYHSWRKPYIDFLHENYKFKIISDEKTSEDQKYLYRNTKINISISLGLKLTTSNRLYNILSSGGFALVYKFPGIEKLFRNHEHLVWFSTIEEMDNLIKHYINDDIQREKIANNGLILYKEKHTALKRVENMYNIMECKTRKFYGFLDS